MAKKKQQKKEVKKQQKPHKSKAIHRPMSAMQILGSGIVMVMAILFLSVNIAASQIIHPLYSKLVNDDPQAWVTFFKITRYEPQAQDYLVDVQGKYQALQEEINADNSTRLEMIARLEELLVANPKARDVLFAISTLYKDSGDKEKAAEYLQRAQEVDPMIN